MTIVEEIALFVEHLRDGHQSTAEPVSKVARLIREKFGSAPVPLSEALGSAGRSAAQENSPSSQEQADARPARTLKEVVDEMLTTYGVKFDDANSREVAIDAWARQLSDALLSGGAQMTARLQPREFHRRLIWLMGADPWPEPDTCFDAPRSMTRAKYEDAMNAQAQLFGFENWIDAWHRFDPDETEMDALMRVAFVNEIGGAPHGK